MKITKRLGQQMNLLSLPEIKISAHQNDWGTERRYAVCCMWMNNRYSIIFQIICFIMKRNRSRGVFSWRITG